MNESIYKNISLTLSKSKPRQAFKGGDTKIPILSFDQYFQSSTIGVTFVKFLERILNCFLNNDVIWLMASVERGLYSALASGHSRVPFNCLYLSINCNFE